MRDNIVPFINEVFGSIRNASTISELMNIPNECNIERKFQMNPPIYPKIGVKINEEEISGLLDSGLLDNDLNLANDASSRIEDPLAKLLYALVWKNGDLKKLKQ